MDIRAMLSLDSLPRIKMKYCWKAIQSSVVKLRNMKKKKKYLKIKLQIDRTNNRVVLAETNKDFVDVLFSFLTLPLGIANKLLRRRSSIGCIRKLYQSVERLDLQYFATDACKSMLLFPKSESDERCHELKIQFNEHGQDTSFYVCLHCFPRNSFYSSVANTLCMSCGSIMINKMGDLTLSYPKQTKFSNKLDGVFVNEAHYIVSDDLCVATSSTNNLLSVLNKFGIDRSHVLQQKTVKVNKRKILKLFGNSLISKTPLTDTFLGKRSKRSNPSENHAVNDAQPTLKLTYFAAKATEYKRISVKVFRNKENNEVLYAEVSGDFLDLVFSFLTFPLGSIMKLLNKESMVGSVDNLYQSVLDLESNMKSAESMRALVNPHLASYFGHENQVLDIGEDACKECVFDFYPYFDAFSLSQVNPKLGPSTATEKSNRYVKAPGRFVVTTKMEVSPWCVEKGLDIIKKSQVEVNQVVEENIAIGEAEALRVLSVSLISTTLSDVFHGDA